MGRSREQMKAYFRAGLLVLGLGGVVFGLAGPAVAQVRPLDLGEFRPATFEPQPPGVPVTNVRLDLATKNLIQYGCPVPLNTNPTSCDPPGGQSGGDHTEQETYIFFPSLVNSGDAPLRYLMDPLTINRTTSLFMIGGDMRFTKLTMNDFSLASCTGSGSICNNTEAGEAICGVGNGQCDANPTVAMFTVESAPLIQIANLTLETDPGYLVMDSDGVPAFRFKSTLDSSFRFEMLDLVATGTKIKIDGPGEYQIQNVSANLLGRVDSFIDINHSLANVTTVGGIIASATEPEVGLLTHCVPQGSSSEVCECADPDFCTTAELDAIDDRCEGASPDEGCPVNPCGCEEHLIWQHRGHLQVFSTGLTSSRGFSNIRIESPATAGRSHVIANNRSEGPKCQTGYPAQFLYVPPTHQAVDVVVLNTHGAWRREPDTCPPYLDPEDFGLNRIADYNAGGTLWLVGNMSPSGAGKVATGTTSGGQIIAIGNQYTGNPDISKAGDVDPENLLPMLTKKCENAPFWSCFEDNDCPGSREKCVAQPLDTQDPNDPDAILAGNSYSIGLFCEAFPSEPECASSPDVTKDVHLASNRSFTDYLSIPGFPTFDVPDPISLVPVPSLLSNLDLRAHWVDAADFRNGICDQCDPSITTNYLPSHCDPTNLLQPPSCWIQAALNRGWAEAKPVLIPDDQAWTLDSGTPLHWYPFDSTIPTLDAWPGGWIAGEDNNAILSGDGSVFTTEGMAHSVIQGIKFATSSTTETTVDIENRYDHVGQASVGPNTVHIVVHDVDTVGGQHGLGLCLESPTQCDTIMSVNGSFNNAEVGWAVGGFNALGLVAYNASLMYNDFAIGHDPSVADIKRCFGVDPIPDDGNDWDYGEPECTPKQCDGQGNCTPDSCTNDLDLNICQSAGYGNWAMLKGNIVKQYNSIADARLSGGSYPIYHHGVTSDNEVALDETTSLTQNHSIIFNDAEWTFPSNETLVRAHFSGPVVFIRSDLDSRKIDREPANTSVTANSAFKIDSFAPRWSDNVTEVATSVDEELEFCAPQALCCVSSGPVQTSTELGDTACLDSAANPPAWIESTCTGGTLELEEGSCPISGGSCPQAYEQIVEDCP